jgi:excisionase family DNA binding protein
VHQSARHTPDTLLSLDEVATMARVDLSDVTEAVRDRKLAAHQERGEWRVRVADVRRWLSHR